MNTQHNYSFKGGSTSVSVDVFIGDSSVTTGAGKTGLAFNTASLVAYYHRPGAASAVIALATQTVTGAFSSGGFVEIDATNMPGWYRLDVPNAALATGVKFVTVALKGAANMSPCNVTIAIDPPADLVSIDGQATNGNNATLKLKALNVTASDGTAPITFRNADSGGNGSPVIELRSDDVAGGDVLLIRTTDAGGGLPVNVSSGGANTPAVKLVGNGTAQAVVLGSAGTSGIQGNLVGKVTGAGAAAITGIGAQASFSQSAMQRPGG